ncbi:SAM-dependent methyltransferase [Allostella humosa]|nr:SAM-dependent methyltransferase [Stella humosa]
MWWFHGLHGNLAAMLARAGAPSGPVLDAGCGTGGLLRRLSAWMPDAAFVGLDRDPRACAETARRWAGPVVLGSVDRLPFATGSLGAIVSADVLCHAGVDEAAALAEAHRCLRPGGAYVLNLPAYRWMFSDHDRAVDNARRYGRADLAAALARAGFAPVRVTYWNTLLFPLMAARRKLWPGGTAASDVGLAPAPVERLFAGLVGLERRWLAAGRSLPFGGSVLAMGIKPLLSAPTPSIAQGSPA